MPEENVTGRRHALLVDVTQAASEVSRLVHEARNLSLPIEPGSARAATPCPLGRVDPGDPAGLAVNEAPHLRMGGLVPDLPRCKARPLGVVGRPRFVSSIFLDGHGLDGESLINVRG
jgi:hypothetical protein